MSVTWGQRCRSFFRNGKNLKAGWLVAAGVAALYVGVIRPHENSLGIANLRGTSLSVDNSRVEVPRNEHARPLYQLGAPIAGVIGGVPGGIASSRAGPFRMMAYVNAPESPHAQDEDKSAAPDSEDRKMVRTCSLELIVLKPAETAEKIRALAEREGGFLMSSQMRGDQDANGGGLSIRVPVARFEEVRAEIRKLAVRVESEAIEAQDVTRQYVDQEANLRNLRAEEAQYLAILKQARTVKDTLDVSEKLSGVRGQIEQQQAEFEALSKQTETVAINVTLRAEAEARVLGLNWRPLYQVKMALRDGLDGLATYASTMTAIVFFLPTVALWLATIVLGCVIGWRLVRWVGRRWFGWKTPEVPVQA